MRYIVILLMFVTACGYSSKDNEAVGQIKRVHTVTPVLCSDRTDVDVSLGVMRNGTGSVSTHDIYFVLHSYEAEKILRSAMESGQLVKIHYNERRITFCEPKYEIVSAELVNK